MRQAIDAAVCPITVDVCKPFQPCFGGYACVLATL
jgi:hypothetical protein